MEDGSLDKTQRKLVSKRLFSNDEFPEYLPVAPHGAQTLLPWAKEGALWVGQCGREWRPFHAPLQLGGTSTDQATLLVLLRSQATRQTGQVERGARAC